MALQSGEEMVAVQDGERRDKGRDSGGNDIRHEQVRTGNRSGNDAYDEARDNEGDPTDKEIEDIVLDELLARLHGINDSLILIHDKEAREGEPDSEDNARNHDKYKADQDDKPGQDACPEQGRNLVLALLEEALPIALFAAADCERQGGLRPDGDVNRRDQEDDHDDQEPGRVVNVHLDKLENEHHRVGDDADHEEQLEAVLVVLPGDREQVAHGRQTDCVRHMREVNNTCLYDSPEGEGWQGGRY